MQIDYLLLGKATFLGKMIRVGALHEVDFLLSGKTTCLGNII